MNRHWVFVRNNYTDDDEHAVFAMAEDAQAVSCGREVGALCGTPHLQGCVSFKTEKSGRQLQAMLPGFDHEPKSEHSTFAQMYGYTAKGKQSHEEWATLGVTGPNYGRDADVFCSGRRPLDAKEKGEKERERCKRNLELCLEDRIEDMDSDIVAKQLRNYQYGAENLKRRRNVAQKLRGPRGVMNEFHYSRTPGTGKSEYARLANPGCYEHPMRDQFMLGYDYQKVVVYQDIDPRWAAANAAHFKRSFDLAPYKARIMYGHKDIRPEREIITSNYTPEELWNPTDAAAMRDRFMFYDWGDEPYLISKVPRIRNPAWKLPKGLQPVTDTEDGDPPSPNRFSSHPSRLEDHTP